TDIPSNLIIVDNASKSIDVRHYLNSIRDKSIINDIKIFNETNEGLVEGTNRGLMISKSQFVCLLNNECVVTRSWLSEMIALAKNLSPIVY
ncbi:glycosyltransferase family 2 protein, partial [Candidatus Omnitrophus magneticus]